MARPPSNSGLSFAAYVDNLQASGRYAFSRDEASRVVSGSELALEAGLRRLKARGRIVTPRRGFHVIVPIEYRDAGSPPAAWFIDALMQHLGQPYYVGLLSAAALHGAAHQQPMVFQVLTDRATRPARAGRVRIAFHKSRTVDVTPTVAVQTDTGTMRASTPEATAFDLVRFAGAAGHLSNVATVLGELVERCDPGKLARIAPLHAIPDVQRLGFLFELLGHSEHADALESWLGRRRFRPVLLAPRLAARGAKTNARWRVKPNVVVEADR